MDALTPEERAKLNAWIAEHVYGWSNVRFGTMVNLAMLGSTERWYGTPPNGIEQAVPNYAGDWGYAGPLFDRYPGFVLMHNGYYFACTFGTQSTRGTTGPEAIAKAVKAYEEQKRT